MKKRNILFLLALTTALSLTACRNTSQDTSAGAQNTESIVSTETVEPSESTEVIPETEVVVETESETEEIVNNSENTSNNVDSVTGNPIVVQDGIEYIFPADKYEIIDGCYKGVPLKGETLRQSWECGCIWTSSSGFEIKINDYASYLWANGELDTKGTLADLWMEDPDRDIKPGSEWNKAVDEFCHRSEQYDTDIVDIDKLPEVTTTSEKRSSFNINNEFQAYIDEWSIYHTFQGSAMWENNPAYALQVNSDFAGSVAMGQGYLWEIERENDYWKLTIRRNLSELNWDGILNCMKMIFPSAEIIHKEVYDAFYTGDTTYLNDYDVWTQIEDSEILIVGGKNKGYSQFYIR